jgi:stage III sporulation protein AH
MQPVKFLKFLRQFVVLVERNLQLIWNDKLLLASLTLQSPFMVLVVKLTADPNCFTSNLVNIGSRTALFVLAAMATFMGTLNSYREICREREIILREASVGVSLPAVVLSKAAVLLLVCAAVYMNWRYTDDIQKNAGKTLGQTTLVSSQDGEKGTEPTAAPAEDDYFATARLSRKQARDNAISMLKEAERDENAQQSVLNEASQTLQVLAAYTVAESQIESLVTAKGYADCVVFMGAESVSVVVAPPEGGLTATDAARIKDIVISETDYTAQQIKIMEAN